MEWQATDQFGNLYVYESEAKTLDDLRPELASMVEELCARTPGPIRITIDIDYAELNGPDPEQVSHVLRVPNLASFHSDDSPQNIREGIAAVVAEKGIDRIVVELA